jgi:hypothetical protein
MPCYHRQDLNGRATLSPARRAIAFGEDLNGRATLSPARRAIAFRENLIHYDNRCLPVDRLPGRIRIGERGALGTASPYRLWWVRSVAGWRPGPRVIS